MTGALLAPIGLGTLVFAKLSRAIMFGMVNAFVPVVFAAFLTDLGGINWPIIIITVLIALTSALIGLFIAVSAKEVSGPDVSNFLDPMLFLCGLFIPIAELPGGKPILRPTLDLWNRYIERHDHRQLHL